ncbi:MAG: DUF1016 domain-containing protein [Treponema sp.]|jgi:hypothetical protein|nr:DUF1016 domain-containing protein [Treponema sp.]
MSDFLLKPVPKRLLKCFVIVGLKTSQLTQKLMQQDIGQMDMYIRMFDELKHGVDDAPTLGVMLCADEDETIVWKIK